MPFTFHGCLMARLMISLLAALAPADPPHPTSNTYLFQMLRCPQLDHVTVHGLWPQWAEWCPGPAFNATALAPLLPDLRTNWPSCEGDHNGTAFWEHEWRKHGVCAGFGSEYAYFAAALALRDEYAPLGSLRVCLDRHLERIPCPSAEDGGGPEPEHDQCEQ